MPAKRPAGVIEVYRRNVDRLWEWRARAANGQVVASSAGQGYRRPGQCHAMARRYGPRNFVVEHCDPAED